MACDFIHKTSAYLDGELSVADRAAYLSHAALCPDCAVERARLEGLSRFLGAARGTTTPAKALDWRRRLQHRQLVRFASVLTAAAVVVIVACGVPLLKSGGSKDQTPTWAMTAFNEQFESPSSAAETDDPVAQALLIKEQP